MTGLVDRTSLFQVMRRNPAVGPPATIAETMSSVSDTLRFTFSAPQDVYNKYEELRVQAEEEAGDRLFNPQQFPTTVHDKMETEFFRRYDELRERFPNLPPASRELINKSIEQDINDAKAVREEVANRETGFLSGTAAFVAGAGVILDPVILGSMALGAPVGASLTRLMLTEAAIGVASEAALQGITQAVDVQFGQEPSLRDALEAMALAGLGGAAGSALIRGGIRGVRALAARGRALPEELQTQAGMDGVQQLEHVGRMEDWNPFPDTALGRGQHQQFSDATMQRMLRGSAAGERAQRFVEPRVALRTRELSIEQIERGVSPETVGEPIELHLARVEAANPELFARVTAARGKVSQIRGRLLEIEDSLSEEPGGVFDRARRRDELRSELKETKQTLLKRRIVKRMAELDQGGNVMKEARAIRASREALEVERRRLRKKLPGAQDHANRLIVKENQAIQRLPPDPALAVRAFHLKQTLASMDDRQLTRDMLQFATFGERLSALVADDAPLGPIVNRPRPRVQKPTDVLEPDSAETMAKEAVDQIKARAELAERLDIPERFEFFNEQTGNFETMSAKDMLDELADDQKLINEIAACAKGII